MKIVLDTNVLSELMKPEIDNFGKIYYCPVKCNRLVDDSGGVEKYKRIYELQWSKTELLQGKLIKIHKFPKDQFMLYR